MARFILAFLFFIILIMVVLMAAIIFLGLALLLFGRKPKTKRLPAET